MNPKVAQRLKHEKILDRDIEIKNIYTKTDLIFAIIFGSRRQNSGSLGKGQINIF